MSRATADWRTVFLPLPSEIRPIGGLKSLIKNDCIALDAAGRTHRNAAEGGTSGFAGARRDKWFDMLPLVPGTTTTSSLAVMARSNRQVIGAGMSNAMGAAVPGPATWS